jgi:hypothetical protein
VAFDNAKNPPPPPKPALPAPDPNAPAPDPTSQESADFMADYRKHLTEQLDAA